MSEILKTTILGLIFGTFGTTIGGFIGVTLKTVSNRVLSFILEFAAGLMISVVCFELIPEALDIARLRFVFVGILLGVVTMIFCESFIKKRVKERRKSAQSSLLKTGIIVGIGLAIHNFPEGLAIGSGFESSFKLGISLAIAIAMVI